MGGLCNGKLGAKFNEVFSELMEGDLSKACRCPFIMITMITVNLQRSQSITLYIAEQVMGSQWRLPGCARPMLFLFLNNAVSSHISWY